LREIWFFQVTTVRQLIVAGWNTSTVGFPGVSGSALLPLLQWLFAYLCLPLVYGICLWKLWRRPRAEGSDRGRMELLVFVGAAMYLEVAQSPSWLRFYAVAFPGVILMVWAVARMGRFASYARGILWAGVFVLAGVHTWHAHAVNSIRQEFPGGRLAATPAIAEKLAWLAAHTGSGEQLLLAQWPGLYLPLSLRNPVFLDLMAGAAATRPEYVRRSLEQLQAQRVEYIVISPRYLARDPMPAAFASFVKDRYVLQHAFSDQDEVWTRKPE
jgi:hypothetical protein